MHTFCIVIFFLDKIMTSTDIRVRSYVARGELQRANASDAPTDIITFYLISAQASNSLAHND